MYQYYRIFIVLFAYVLISACGGGSDGGSNRPTPVPTPVITSFTASITEISTGEIHTGETINLTAIFANGKGSIDMGVGNVSSGETIVIAPKSSTTYTLTVENSAGIKVSTPITIEVVPIRILGIIHPRSSDSGETVHDNTYIEVKVSSHWYLWKVTAKVESNSAEMAYLDNSNQHKGEFISSGYMSLAGIPDGDYTLNVTAQSTDGSTASATKQITIDNLPVLNTHSLRDYTSVNAQLPLDISCSDSSGYCQITVKHQDTVLASATNNLDETIDLSHLIDEQILLTIEGKTDSGQVTTKPMNLYVSEHDVEKVLINEYHGSILDFDGERTLILDEIIENGNTYHQLHIANLTTDEIDDIQVPSGNRLRNNEYALTPTGAVFRTEYFKSYQWHNGELFSFGITSIIENSGDYLVYCDDNTLYRRASSTNTNLVLKTGVSSCGYAVTSNGKVAYSKWGLSIYDGTEIIANYYPAEEATSDGAMFAFAFRPNEGIHDLYSVILHDGDKEIFSSAPSTYLSPYSNNFYLTKEHYQVNNGWLTYLDNPDRIGNNYWSRSPEGEITQRTNFYSNGNQTSGYLEALASNGEAMFIHGGLRYLSKPDGELITLGFSLGKAVHKNNTWYLIEGNTLSTLTINN